MRAEKVFFHDDDCGVILTGGECPVCKFPPDMQSLGIMWMCPTHRVELHGGMRCPICGIQFERPA